MPEIDYAAVFAAAPSPYLLLDPGLRIVDVNQAYLHATGRSRDELIGRRFSEAFPDDSSEAETPVRTLEAALREVLASGRPDMSVLQRYDLPVEGRPGDVEQRWRSPTITPIPDTD
ncbi:MAG TPA: PAS domain-containing protein, partial [Actinopolymorphaceae bacterium]